MCTCTGVDEEVVQVYGFMGCLGVAAILSCYVYPQVFYLLIGW